MREKILEFLKKKQGYISGEEIAEHLKISRQALWKHIHELKEGGYDIVAVPHLGYSLQAAPDRLYGFEIASGLDTEIFGKKIFYYESLSSTMEQAMQLGLEGAHCGSLVVAECQTKGRGRLGRSWFSPKYKGIYFSLIIRPEIPPQQAPLLTLLSAVSVSEAIKNITGLSPAIKWPNDIILNHKKLGGILTELNAETDKINFAVIGIGLNVNNEEKSLVTGSTSLKCEKKESIERLGLLQEILRRLEVNYLGLERRGAQPIIKKLRHLSLTIGRQVKVYSHHRHIAGLAVDIDTDGSLLVRTEQGLVERVVAGDVTHCR
jgi:BirA family biotin operon repressor/biotin-[acetyl-CoA-carboxylase] ligase